MRGVVFTENRKLEVRELGNHVFVWKQVSKCLRLRI